MFMRKCSNLLPVSKKYIKVNCIKKKKSLNQGEGLPSGFSLKKGPAEIFLGESLISACFFGCLGPFVAIALGGEHKCSTQVGAPQLGALYHCAVSVSAVSISSLYPNHLICARGSSSVEIRGIICRNVVYASISQLRWLNGPRKSLKMKIKSE